MAGNVRVKHMNLDDYDVGDEAGLVESQDRTQGPLPGPGWFPLNLQDPVTTPQRKNSLATRVATAVLALVALNLPRPWQWKLQ